VLVIWIEQENVKMEQATDEVFKDKTKILGKQMAVTNT
jgi:hypothetical protein